MRSTKIGMMVSLTEFVANKEYAIMTITNKISYNHCNLFGKAHYQIVNYGDIYYLI
jgi:hypothetical protein